MLDAAHRCGSDDIPTFVEVGPGSDESPFPRFAHRARRLDSVTARPAPATSAALALCQSHSSLSAGDVLDPVIQGRRGQPLVSADLAAPLQIGHADGWLPFVARTAVESHTQRTWT